MKRMLPIRSISSAEKATNMIVARCGFWASRRAISSRAATPVPLSSAPGA